MTTSSSESSLFNIEKLDGTNFPFWKEQIYNVLVQKRQVMLVKLKGIKPEGITEAKTEEKCKAQLERVKRQAAYHAYHDVDNNVDEIVTQYVHIMRDRNLKTTN